MSEYSQVKIGKLKLKGSSSSSDKKKGKKKKRKLAENPGGDDDIPADDDAKQHGGWWKIRKFDQLAGGNVALQLHNTSYLFARDNGTLVCGDPHHEGDTGPVQEEIYTMIKISDTKIALKTGYGKYISVNAMGNVTARTEAVGPQEQLEVVIQDEKMALQGHNGYFITLNDGLEVKALSSTAKEKEIVCLRTDVSRVKKKKVNEEDVCDVREFEIKYVKDFQSFEDRKLKLHEGPKASLEKARTAGKLHEAMLDRREKMKADRYCK